MSNHSLPDTGFLRKKQILGDPKANPPIPAIIPVSNASWYDGIKKGIYPKPVYLSARTVAWSVESIRDLIDRINQHAEPDLKA